MESLKELEVWKDVPGYENMYQVSSLGNCRRILNLKSTLSQSGYPAVRFEVGKKVYNKSVHLLVAELFCEKKSCHKVVNHKDHNVLNNQAKNLEWVSIRENVSHSKEFGDYTSKYVGVCKPRNSPKFQASISFNGKKKYLGSYDTEEEASLMYRKAVEILGEQNRYYNKSKINQVVSGEKLAELQSLYTNKKQSKYRGVKKNLSTGKYDAIFMVNKKRYYLRGYDCPQEAYSARLNEMHRIRNM